MNQSSGKSQNPDRAARLVEERKRLGLTIQRFADLAGISKGSQILYEKGNAPAADYLAAIAKHGVDVLYVLTARRTPGLELVREVRRKHGAVLDMAELGESIERIEEAEAAAGRARERDNERLAAAIAAVEEGLAGAGRSLDPDRKAELILAAYDLLEEDTPSYRDRIVRLVRAS